MANTYTQIYMHVIFAVKGRESMIRPEWQDELYRYMAGALKNHEHTPYIINGMEDHVHLLFGMTPKESLSELVQSLKIQSTKHIKEQYGRLLGNLVSERSRIANRFCQQSAIISQIKRSTTKSVRLMTKCGIF